MNTIVSLPKRTDEAFGSCSATLPLIMMLSPSSHFVTAMSLPKSKQSETDNQVGAGGHPVVASICQQRKIVKTDNRDNEELQLSKSKHQTKKSLSGDVDFYQLTGCLGLGALYRHFYLTKTEKVCVNEKAKGKSLGWTTSEDAAMVRSSIEVAIMAVEDQDLAPTRSASSCESDMSSKTISTRKTSSTNSSTETKADSQAKLYLIQRYALSVATNPKRHLFITLVVCALLTVAAIVGAHSSGFEINFELEIWLTRFTPIANRAMQQYVHLSNAAKIFGKSNNDTKHFVDFDGQTINVDDPPSSEVVCSGQWYGSPFMTSDRQLNFNTIWTTKGDSQSALDSTALYEMCLNEEHVLQVLEENDLCYKCPVDDDAQGQESCIRPYSLVAAARLYLQASSTLSMDLTPSIYLTPSLSCEDLQTAWTEDVQASFSDVLVECANALLEKYELKDAGDGHSTQCLLPDAKMVASLVDFEFPSTGNVKHSSAVYATKHDSESLDQMYQLDKSNSFAQDCSALTGLYEVGVSSIYLHEDGGFYWRNVNETVSSDLSLGIVACLLSAVVILLHTKSPFLTAFGLLQIILSLPITFIIYRFLFGFRVFPVANVIGVFIVLSLGADDIFVMVDKWKSARSVMINKDASTSEVATVAIPSASTATFLTSFTTSVGFLATNASSVLGVKLFGTFCGILIIVDYILTVLILSPALCLYDKQIMDGSLSRFVSIQRRNKVLMKNENSSSDAKVADSYVNESLLQKLLKRYFNLLYAFRWAALIVSIGTILACSFIATAMKPPEEGALATIFPPTNRYEIHMNRAKNLISGSIQILLDPKLEVQMVYGLLPIDNGNQFDLDPGTIAYDNDFDPANNQLYLLDMCDKIEKPDEDYICSLKEFDTWLKEQSNSSSPDGEYTNSCDGETSLPVTVDTFDQCFIAFSKLSRNGEVTYVENKVKTVVIRARTDLTMMSPLPVMSRLWRSVEDWSVAERFNAPNGANNFFFSSFVFWYYDTFNNTTSSSVKSACLVVCCAALVILVSSRSVTLMLFSGISILYVLVAATASLAGMGWTLGIFESVLFAILVGLGSDFTLHFAHAYSMLPGKASKTVRVKHAILHMGPSILGSAATTLLTAFVMIFCQLILLKKFAIMVTMTMVHSLIGSFVIFSILCLLFGPAEPTKRFDSLRSKMKKKKGVTITNSGEDAVTVTKDPNVVDILDVDDKESGFQPKRWMSTTSYIIAAMIVSSISVGAVLSVRSHKPKIKMSALAEADVSCVDKFSNRDACRRNYNADNNNHYDENADKGKELVEKLFVDAKEHLETQLNRFEKLFGSLAETSN